MSSGNSSSSNARSAERRAEQLVERVVTDGSRWIRRIAGLVREEVEDIVAEGKTRAGGSRTSGSRTSDK
jgi:DNA-directed RNA polymerase specialized sigma24 family protein